MTAFTQRSNVIQNSTSEFPSKATVLRIDWRFEWKENNYSEGVVAICGKNR